MILSIVGDPYLKGIYNANGFGETAQDHCWRPNFERYLQHYCILSYKVIIVGDPILKGIYNLQPLDSFTADIVGDLILKGIYNRHWVWV